MFSRRGRLPLLFPLSASCLPYEQTLVIPTRFLTSGPTGGGKLNIADAVVARLTSDRSDGLFPTVVSSETGHTLGLVYSSKESIKESILTGKGVYHSRKHGLWRKGETSGATQDIVSIHVDCDSDALEYRVVQAWGRILSLKSTVLLPPNRWAARIRGNASVPVTRRARGFIHPQTLQ